MPEKGASIKLSKEQPDLIEALVGVFLGLPRSRHRGPVGDADRIDPGLRAHERGEQCQNDAARYGT
jgi:hypothetical protein